MKSLNSSKTRSNEDEDGDDYDGETNKRIGKNLFVSVKRSFQYDFYFDEPIGAKADFRQLLQLLYNANNSDVVRLFISGPGGDVDTLLDIINAVNCTDATVIGILTGQASSAHSILALAVPQLQVCERARMMLHSASMGDYGKLQEVESNVAFTRKILDSVVDEFYAGFLTADEIKEMSLGRDFYMQSPEIMKRLKRRADHHKKIEQSGGKNNTVRNKTVAKKQQ